MDDREEENKLFFLYEFYCFYSTSEFPETDRLDSVKSSTIEFVFF